MFFFILAVVSSALVSILMRTSENHVRNNITMLLCNYLVCMLMAMLTSGTLEVFPEGSGFALGLGLFSGVLYLGAFVLLQWNIAQNGVALPATFMKLGVLVPTLMAMTLFHEQPTWMQLAGIALAIVAILMIQMDKGHSQAKSGVGLIALLLFGGLANGMNKVYEVYGAPALQAHYLLYTFGTAFVLCAVLCIVRRQSIAWPDVLFGGLIGIPNYLSSYFLLLSLAQLPAVVVFPMFSVCAIVLVTLVGWLAFGEKLSRRQLAAMGVILAALVLLNL